MDDGLEVLALDRAAERRPVGDVDDAQGHALADVRSVACREVVHDDHLIAVRDERVQDVAPHEPGASGHQDPPWRGHAARTIGAKKKEKVMKARHCGHIPAGCG